MGTDGSLYIIDRCFISFPVKFLHSEFGTVIIYISTSSGCMKWTKVLFGMTPTLGGAAPLQNFKWSQLWVELELSDEGVWLGGCLQLQKR